MGRIADAVSLLGSFLPERIVTEHKTGIGAMVPPYESGTTQYPKFFQNYYRNAWEGYSKNEIVFAAVEELATSAAEPRLVAVKKTATGTEQIKDHPLVDLFERPNPFMSRFSLIANLNMHMAIAGNAYLYKTRSAAGKVVQLWPLRPDRVFVVPDSQVHIKGWEYRLEGMAPQFLPSADVIQFRTRNAIDDYYGLAPLAVCAERVDTDAMMRAFTLSFFRNAGVPAGLLTVTKQVGQAERQVVRDRFRMETGGPQNWHQLMVMNDTEAKYQPMGMPLGASGIVLPELDEISEARIAMAFGVPLELIGARLGMIHGNRTTTVEARATFWDETMTPKYQDMGSQIGTSFAEEYDGTPDEYDYVEFDLSTVKALQEDDDAKHARVRADLAVGIISVQEAREAIGKESDFESDAILMIPDQITPLHVQDLLHPQPVPTPLQQPTPDKRDNGLLPAADLENIRKIASGF